VLTGKINSRLEAIVRLWIRGPGDRVLEIDALIDTGFSGFLSLPPDMIASLGLLPHGKTLGTLADGTKSFFPVYRAIISWHGQPRATFVNAIESHPLLGMGALYESELFMRIIDGGEVVVQDLGLS
jgi:clan AA aspartic protease